MIAVLICVSLTAFSDWLVEVKVEGMEYRHNNQFEMALLLETIHNDVATYDSTANYLWKTPENPHGSYNIERWDQLGDLVKSLLYREDYNFVGIYTKNWSNGITLVPYIFIEKRFSEPDGTGYPENFNQKTFNLKNGNSLFVNAFNQGKGFFTTNIKSVIDDPALKTAAREYQHEASVRGYFAYPLKNGDVTIGILVVATKEPGLTEEQFFRIEQYADAATWLVIQTCDLLAHPEKLGW